MRVAKLALLFLFLMIGNKLTAQYQFCTLSGSITNARFISVLFLDSAAPHGIRKVVQEYSGGQFRYSIPIKSEVIAFVSFSPKEPSALTINADFLNATIITVLLVPGSNIVFKVDANHLEAMDFKGNSANAKLLKLQKTNFPLFKKNIALTKIIANRFFKDSIEITNSLIQIVKNQYLIRSNKITFLLDNLNTNLGAWILYDLYINHEIDDANCLTYFKQLSADITPNYYLHYLANRLFAERN